MNDPTFKEIEHKVNLVLCFVALVIALGLAFGSLETVKSKIENEYRVLENNIVVEFNSVKSRCYTVIRTALNKYIASAEAVCNPSRLDTKEKLVGEANNECKPLANTVEGEIHRNAKLSNINTMPVMDGRNPVFKKTRLI